MQSTAVSLIKRNRKLPSGRKVVNYLLRWHNTDGQQVHESIGRGEKLTKKQAEEERRKKELAIGGGKELRDKPRKMTLATFIEQDRLSIAGDVRGSTLFEYDLSMAKATTVLGESMELTRIGVAEAGKIKQHMVDLNRAPATIHKTLRTLRTSFNRAAKLGLIHRNPFLDVKMPKIEASPVRVFTRAEIAAMIDACANDLWWMTFITLATTSGLRRDELLNLKWADIDFDAGTVSVQPKKAADIDVKGIPLKTWDWYAKAKSSYRSVPVPATTIATLQKQRMRQGASPFVFIDVLRLRAIQRHVENGKLPAKFELINNLLRQFTKIQEGVITAKRQALTEARQDPSKFEWPIGCVHDMRRSYCTQLAEAGVPIHALKQYAGHSDISTTSRFYLGVSDSMADKARAAVASA